ncbi:MAG: glycosyltransferase [Candidatus Paceibacterota bacterium]
MTIKHPIISIILPTHNGNPRWLSESIDSVLNQSYENFELIIIDDGSTNNIEETILTYAKKDKRIHYHKNTENLNLTKTLNI